MINNSRRHNNFKCVHTQYQKFKIHEAKSDRVKGEIDKFRIAFRN